MTLTNIFPRIIYKFVKLSGIVAATTFFLFACGQSMSHASESFKISADVTDITTHSNNLDVKEPSVFFKQIMNAAPILPKDIKNRDLSCGDVNNMTTPQRFFRPETQTNFKENYWDTRITRNWAFFDIPKSDGKILVIDFKQAGETLGYRYLANDKTQTDIYEPWSSAKIQAFTGAVAQVRKMNSLVGAEAKIGDTLIADMITSIHRYSSSGSADNDSNALANFFSNTAGRDYLSSLIFDEWLKFADQNVFFRGAFGADSFVPSNTLWSALMPPSKAELPSAPSVNINLLESNSDDPGYLNYTCEQCGNTGNKPMSTLVQAEWLKRLATHERSKQTQHPELKSEDIQVLFYGNSISTNVIPVGGMMQGVSNMLQIAIANAMSNQDVGKHITSATKAKQILDQNTQGKWRVFQKIGWGASDTRKSSENVVLAHVCLPHYQGGREFTVAAQTAIDGNSDESISIAGMQMQINLNKAMKSLLNHPSTL